MTTLYKPVLIESAEQAEALSWGTIARSDAFAPEVFVKDEDSWLGTHGPGAFTNESAVGLEALVPIEAEEEFTATGEDRGEPWIAAVGFDELDGTREEAEAYTRSYGGVLAHRFVTDWEEA